MKNLFQNEPSKTTLPRPFRRKSGVKIARRVEVALLGEN